jgi:hypothetical protein
MQARKPAEIAVESSVPVAVEMSLSSVGSWLIPPVVVPLLLGLVVVAYALARH